MVKSQVAADDPQDEGGNARRFETTLNRVLKVSKEELAKREAAYKKARRSKKTRATRSR